MQRLSSRLIYSAAVGVLRRLQLFLDEREGGGGSQRRAAVPGKSSQCTSEVRGRRTFHSVDAAPHLRSGQLTKGWLAGDTKESYKDSWESKFEKDGGQRIVRDQMAQNGSLTTGPFSFYSHHPGPEEVSKYRTGWRPQGKAQKERTLSNESPRSAGERLTAQESNNGPFGCFQIQSLRLGWY